MQSNVERWMPVVGYEGLYEVSNWGRVKALARMRRHPLSKTGFRPHRERILKPTPKDSGHLTVSLHKEGRQRTLTIHSLVAAAFIGPLPAGQEVRHGENGKLDNCLANLCYGTPAENQADRLRDGTHNRGERSAHARFTEAQVLTIRQQLENGPRGTAARLARELNVSYSAIQNIKQGKSWPWLAS